MSVANLMEDKYSAVVWRGPRKTAMIKRFVKDTFWGRLDYLIFDILSLVSYHCNIQEFEFFIRGAYYSCMH